MTRSGPGLGGVKVSIATFVIPNFPWGSKLWLRNIISQGAISLKILRANLSTPIVSGRYRRFLSNRSLQRLSVGVQRFGKLKLGKLNPKSIKPNALSQVNQNWTLLVILISTSL